LSLTSFPAASNICSFAKNVIIKPSPFGKIERFHARIGGHIHLLVGATRFLFR